MKNVYEKLNYFLQNALFWLGRRGQMQLPEGVTMVEGERLTSFDYRVYTAVCYLLYGKAFRTVTIGEIAEVMDATSKGQRARISKSLHKLATTTFVFDNVLPNKKRVETPLLLVRREGYGRSLQIRITIPGDIWDIRFANLYQVMDYDYFRDIPTNIARRVWEFLDKRRNLHKNGKFEIGEAKLCSYIPLTSKRRYQRLKTLRKHLDVLVDIGYLRYSIDENYKITFEYLHQGKAKSSKKKTVDSVSMSSPMAACKKKIDEQKTSTAAIDDGFQAVCLYDSLEDPEAQKQPEKIQNIFDEINEAPKAVNQEADTIHTICNAKPQEVIELVEVGVEPEQAPTPKQLIEAKADKAKSDKEIIDEIMSEAREQSPSIRRALANALIAKGEDNRSPEDLKAAVAYANKYAKSNYGSYLGRTIKEQWYGDLKEQMDYNNASNAKALGEAERIWDKAEEPAIIWLIELYRENCIGSFKELGLQEFLKRTAGYDVFHRKSKQERCTIRDFINSKVAEKEKELLMAV